LFVEKVAVARFDDLADRTPTGALIENVDLVIIRYGGSVSVMYGRCLHRGAMLADGYVDGDNLMCGVHFWDYRIQTGISEYNNDERLPTFESWIEGGDVLVDADEISAWHADNPQPFQRDAYLGQYADTHPAAEEPHTQLIQNLAKQGLEGLGEHGPMAAMGVPRDQLPTWDDIQFITGQLASPPLLDDV